MKKQNQFKTALRVARPILTLFEYAISVLLIAVTAQLTFGNSLKSYIITAISIVLAITTYAVWYTDGIERGEATKEVYNTSLKFHTYARAITNLQVLSKLKEYCEKKNKEYEQEVVITKLAEYTLELNDLITYKENLKKARIGAIMRPKWQIGKLSIGHKLDLGEEFCNFEVIKITR